MCRLSAYYQLKPSPESSLEAKRVLQDMMMYQEGGGVDAAGVAYLSEEEGAFVVNKEPVKPTEFIAKPETMALFENANPRFMIGHNRAFTHGEPVNNMNNHPLFTKQGTVFVHNGVITNADTLFHQYRFERDAEVDSEIIGKLIDFHIEDGKTKIEAIQETCKELRGTMALIVFFCDEPDALYAIRRENNLSIAMDTKHQVVYVATDEKAFGSLYEWETYLGYFHRVSNATNIITKEIPTKSGVVIRADGITTFTVETPTWTYGQGNYQDWRNGTEYQPKQTTLVATTKEKEDEKTIKTVIKQARKKFKKKLGKEQYEKRNGFDRTKPMTKPSRYTLAELWDRMEYLSDKEVPAPLPAKEEIELKRIEQMIDTRMEALGIDKIDDTPPWSYDEETDRVVHSHRPEWND